MEKKTIRTGIVGAGFAATFHFNCLKQVHGTNVDIVGVFAIDAEQAASYAKERGIRARPFALRRSGVVHCCVCR